MVEVAGIETRLNRNRNKNRNEGAGNKSKMLSPPTPGVRFPCSLQLCHISLEVAA